MAEKDGRPFKASISGLKCVLVVRKDRLEAEFGAPRGPLRIMYTDMRCIQTWGRSVLVSAERDGRRTVYAIETARAKKMYDAATAAVRRFMAAASPAPARPGPARASLS